jgi:hypothetical protein
LKIPIQQLRVEQGSCFYECADCGPQVRKLRSEEWKALALAFDVAGGTRISEREVVMFSLRARRIEQHLEDEGLDG